jgi:hypothetical protein
MVYVQMCSLSWLVCLLMKEGVRVDPSQRAGLPSGPTGNYNIKFEGKVTASVHIEM